MTSSFNSLVRDPLDRFAEAVRSRPFTAILLSNAALTAYYLYVASEGKPVALIKKLMFRAALSVVPQSIVDAEQEKLKSKIESSVIGTAMVGVPAFTSLPDVGISKDAVTALLETGSKRDRAKWDSGKVSGGVYHGGDELSSVMIEAFSRYGLSNPLHPDLFPSVRKVRRELMMRQRRRSGVRSTAQ